MGRTELLTKISNKIKIKNSRKNNWLVTYTFSGSKQNPYFFNKINELTNNLQQKGASADKSQTSVFITNDLHGVITAVKLAKHYGAYTRLYKVDEIIPTASIDPDFEFNLTKEEVYTVMKSVYNELKKRYQDFSHEEDLDELVTFLWVNEFHLIPSTPIKKEDLTLILEQCKYLEEENVTNLRKFTSFGLEFYNIVPIMRAIETYLTEYKDNSTIDTNLLFNILRRLTHDEEDPIEPSIIDIEDLLLEHPVEKLIELIEKSRIAHEIL